MKALVKAKSEPGLWMQDVPVPEYGPNDLLIRITHTAICGTDLHIYHWDDWAKQTVPVPMVTGHEYCGVIEAVGDLVADFKPGDRVSGEGHITCRHCRNCRAGRRHLCRNTQGVGVDRPGSFGEFFSLPATNGFKIPEDIPSEIATILDPFGNATHTALSQGMVGEDVLITGAGPIGVMAAAICRHVGARHVVVTDINEYRLELAKRLGATYTLNPQEKSLQAAMQDLGMREGFDVGLEMSGSPVAFQSMLETMNHGGSVALLGIFPKPIVTDWSQVIFKGLKLKGIYGREMYETWYKMTTMLQSGLDISGIITHRFQVDDYELGFQAMEEGRSGKVILEW
ncbi:L-threonine 3-dehydrogenase [Symmachiella dynata]|uniref:L-threonine 3-dehydrogenase n=1 Tax=Symmachiella dynata TaxID=2527995 RepID=UPI001188BFA9|nr:L-threonine 3-dehydrogenase [Symmachiella dynata]QDT46670.1 L-threonine 3-dehydrogenase [Symmachiella dynata]